MASTLHINEGQGLAVAFANIGAFLVNIAGIYNLFSSSDSSIIAVTQLNQWVGYGYGKKIGSATITAKIYFGDPATTQPYEVLTAVVAVVKPPPTFRVIVGSDNQETP